MTVLNLVKDDFFVDSVLSETQGFCELLAVVELFCSLIWAHNLDFYDALWIVDEHGYELTSWVPSYIVM